MHDIRIKLFVVSETKHWRDVSFRKRPWKLAKSGEVELLPLCYEQVRTDSLGTSYIVAPDSKQMLVHSIS